MTSSMMFKSDNMAINSHQRQQQLEELSHLRRARETSDYIIAIVLKPITFSVPYIQEIPMNNISVCCLGNREYNVTAKLGVYRWVQC